MGLGLHPGRSHPGGVMAVNKDKLQDRFQALLDQGYSPKAAMLIVVDDAVDEDLAEQLAAKARGE